MALEHYVKFMRGTFEAYNKLTEKNDDTLYFIYDEDSNESSLYLGYRKIVSSDGDVINESSIDALADVLISENLTDKSFLIYDAQQSQWINADFNKLLFVGATATSNGVAGFVPAPEMKQTNLFLRSDGTWVEIPAANDSVAQNILNITNESQKDHSDIIKEAVADLSLSKGDIIIIKDIISVNNNKHTAYVYDGTEWIALTNNYTTEQVFLAEDFIDIGVAGDNLTTVLQNILSKLTIHVDNATMVLDNNLLNLKDYGTQYYKYIPAIRDEDTGETIAAHYEIQIVDEEHPWIAGLEPRVTSENGQLVLAWFEQNPTTIDGVNAQVSALSTNVTDLQQITNTLTAEILNKADVANVYTKDEVDKKIATEVATSEHLKRKIVSVYEDIQKYIDDNNDAEQYIFMVPVGVTDYDNKYKEYIVINGIIEPVGDWSVNLDGYVTKEELLFTSINGNEFQVIEKQLNLLSIPQNKIVGLSDLVTQVGTLETSVENINNTINGLNSTTSTLQTALNQLDTKVLTFESQVKNLESDLNTTKTQVTTLSKSLNAVESKVLTLENAVTNLNSTYLTIEQFNATVGNLDDLINSKQNIQTQINELKTQMSWQTL